MAATRSSAVTSGRRYRRIRARKITDEDYEYLLACCCHRLGRRRPHLACECRELSA